MKAYSIHDAEATLVKARAILVADEQVAITWLAFMHAKHKHDQNRTLYSANFDDEALKYRYVDGYAEFATARRLHQEAKNKAEALKEER